MMRPLRVLLDVVHRVVCGLVNHRGHGSDNGEATFGYVAFKQDWQWMNWMNKTGQFC